MCGDSALPQHFTEELLAAPHRPHFLAHHINKRIADARGIPEFGRLVLNLSDFVTGADSFSRERGLLWERYS